MLITFSGLDGSGKSTLIQRLKEWLESESHPVTVLTMYDDISFYSILRKLRDGVKSLFAFCRRDEPRQARPAKSAARCPDLGVRDKKEWWRKCIYGIVRSPWSRTVSVFLDMILLLLYRLYYEKIKKRILVADRYLYDTLVDIVHAQKRNWKNIHVLLSLTPRPTLPVFVDVEAQEAYRRKSEYTLSFLDWRRTAYLKIFDNVAEGFVLENTDLEKTWAVLRREVERRFPGVKK